MHMGAMGAVSLVIPDPHEMSEHELLIVCPCQDPRLREAVDAVSGAQMTGAGPCKTLLSEAKGLTDIPKKPPKAELDSWAFLFFWE